MIDPHTGEGFDAPAPDAAYAGAPAIVREISNVLALTTSLHRCDRTADGREREQRLRKAALLDRIALFEATEYAPGVAAEAIATAATAARKLAAYDTEHHTSTGPIGPNSPEWDPCHRPYVRQEYATWVRLHADT
ncbi:hypothetical protein [Streptomyces sp. CA-111067]|uniref:hypothetical protein n=1 Tax=Streptomyces sp. CA-111067 TaxID=3240046 RepID=UPI003D98E90B